jgi:hypothetical protein
VPPSFFNLSAKLETDGKKLHQPAPPIILSIENNRVLGIKIKTAINSAIPILPILP